MYIKYSKIGDSIFLTDEEGNVHRKDNVDNIESIVMLENELDNSDLRIENELVDQKKYKRIRNTVLCVGSLTILNSSISLATRAGTVSPVLLGSCVLSTVAGVSMISGIVNTINKNIKNIKVYKEALNKELNYKISKSNKVVSSENINGDISNDKNEFKLTYDKYDLMHESIVSDYKQNGSIKCPLFNESEKRIFSFMIEEEFKNKRKVKEI